MDVTYLGRKPNSLIGDFNPFLPLVEHDFDEYVLDWESEDEDA